MAAKDLAQLTVAIQLVTTSRKVVEDIKLYRQQCTDINTRCLTLIRVIQDWAPRIDAAIVLAISEEVTVIIRRMAGNFTEWAALTRLRSFLLRRQMKEEIDSLNCDFDITVKKFNKSFGSELERYFEPQERVMENTQHDSEYEEEARSVPQKIVQSPEDMNKMLHTQSRPLEDIIENLQMELRSSNLQQTQAQILRHGLWLPFKGSSKFFLRSDLTGQIRMKGEGAIAQGPFSIVFLGEWLDNKLVTLHLPRTLAKTVDSQKQFERAVSMWRSFDHPNIVPIYGSVCIGGNIYAVRSWMDNGNIMTYLEKDPSADRLKIIHEVASGLEYLHLNGVVHGDLRGVNIMMSSDGTARLSDFGLHHFLGEPNSLTFSSQSADAHCFPPEVLQQCTAWSTSSDAWSFAVVSLEILTGKRPPPVAGGRSAPLKSDLPQDNIPDRPGPNVTKLGLSDDMWSLMIQCWQVAPESRPSMTDVKGKLVEIRALSPPSGSPGAYPPPRSHLRRRATDSALVESSQRLGSGHHGQIRGVQRRGSVQRIIKSSLGDLQENPPTVYLETSVGGLPRHSLVVDSASVYSGESISSGVRSRLSTSSTSATGGSRTSLSLPGSFGMQYRHCSPALSKEYFKSKSSIHMSSSLQAAVNNPEPIIHFDDSGQVASGTLEGLIEELISNLGTEADLLYRNILFTSCTDFTSLEDLFDILVRRFSEAEDAESNYQERQRTDIQDNILGIMGYWLTDRHLHLDSQLLSQMKNFCITTNFIKGSIEIEGKADGILRLIDDRLNQEEQSSSFPLSPGRRMPRTSEIMPRDLAIALALLEGDKYKVILPTDYIAHLEKQDRPNNVEAAYLTNNRIVLWVKQSVLHYDAIDSRAQVLKFFVNTAMECRKLHNFASLTAIANALHSAPIDRLRLTKRELPQALRQALDEFDELLDPSHNHRAYRAALKELSEDENSNSCIPWIAVHLRELFSTLQKYPSVVEVDGLPLINFERYSKFTARIKEVLHYVPPDLEGYRQHGQLAYLEHQLRGVYTKPNVEEELMERSLALEAEETRDYRTRKRELKRLGFKI